MFKNEVKHSMLDCKFVSSSLNMETNSLTDSLLTTFSVLHHLLFRLYLFPKSTTEVLTLISFLKI